MQSSDNTLIVGTAVVAVSMLLMVGFGLSKRAEKKKPLALVIDYEGQEDAVTVFLDKLRAHGNVGKMDFGDRLVVEWTPAGTRPIRAMVELLEKYGLRLLNKVEWWSEGNDRAEAYEPGRGYLGLG